MASIFAFDKLFSYVAILLLILSLEGCGTTTTQTTTIDPTNLNALENLSQQCMGHGECGIGSIRYKALEDTALSLSAQGGLAYASEQINSRLCREGKYLDTIYNFNGMMLSHGVIPPVLAEGDNSLNLADPTTIRIADKTYKIVEQARFATTPPNWREYLWMNYTKPEIPHKFLLPRCPEEKRAWVQAVRTGWEKGQIQAFSIFQQNMARLKRDYKGMILYRKLLQMRMISAPYVSRTELGVTGDGSDMRINDQVLRITALPTLQTNSCGWQAIVVNQDAH